MKSDLQEANIKGKVKTITESEYEGVKKYGEFEKKKLLSKTTHHYNELGNEILKVEEKALVFHSLVGDATENLTQSSVVARYETVFDGNGHKMELNYYNPINGLIWKIRYVHDSNGNTTKANRYWGEGAIKEVTYLYNNNSEAMNPDAYYIERVLKLNEYGNNSTAIERANYSPGSLHRTWTIKYDDKGNKAEENIFSPNSSLLETHRWTYDANNNTVKAVFLESGLEAKGDSIIYRYGTDNNKTEEYDYHSNATTQQTFKYDKHNNQIKAYSYKPDGTIEDSTTYRYEYDKLGNWIKKSTFHHYHTLDLFNDNPNPRMLMRISLVEREIEYY